MSAGLVLEGGKTAGRSPRAAIVCACVAAEIAVILSVQAVDEFGCFGAGDLATCEFFAGLPVRGLAVVVTGILYLMTRGGHVLANLGSQGPPGWPWACLQFAGFLLILSPLQPFGPGFEGAAPAVYAWIAGVVFAGSGTLFWLMPPRLWISAWRRDGPLLAVLAVAALLSPDILAQADRAWQWSPLAGITFAGVVALLGLFGEPYADAEAYVIGIGDFAVHVGQPCSGIQGLALIGSFLLLYFYLHRRELPFPRVWWLLPIGLVSSFVLNVVRITTLILLGASGSPELAVGAFHSRAGWLLFTLLAFSLIAVSRKVAWFRVDGSPVDRTVPTLFRDPNAAMILPFIVLVVSGLAASTMAETPELLYPLRAVVLAATLLAFAPLIGTMVANPAPRAIAVGFLVGLGWVLLPGAQDDGLKLDAEISALGSLAYMMWIGFRLAGTALLVPIAEEAFFRGYLLRRFERGGLTPLIALVASSALFAVLHERWLAAGVSGLLFGALMQQRYRLSDAIAAHVAANIVVATWALVSGNWSLI